MTPNSLEATFDRLKKALNAEFSRRSSRAHSRLGPPIKRPGKIIGIGLNYRDHAVESNMLIPMSQFCSESTQHRHRPYDDVRYSARSARTTGRSELGVIIGRQASYLQTPTEALSYVAGYTIFQRPLRTPSINWSAMASGTRESPATPSTLLAVARDERRDSRPANAELVAQHRRSPPEQTGHDLPT